MPIGMVVTEAGTVVVYGETVDTIEPGTVAVYPGAVVTVPETVIVDAGTVNV